ncbi:MAG: lysophospholipid acyltransferase family protein [Planctomycetota bacterium]|nr:lysophospholipid acyltransferase family protein [Planctomycetota bacterium]
METLPICAAPARFTAQSLAFALAKPWRETLIANAAFALGPSSTRLQRMSCAFSMMGEMQRLISDVLASKELTLQQLSSRVTSVEGSPDYHSARQLRKGVIIAGIHMGAFEPALAILCQYERKVHLLFQPDPMSRFERARSAIRKRLNVVEHHISDGIAAWDGLLCALNADEAVVMHGDFLLPGQRGVLMPFLGCKSANLPSGLVRLSSASGAPIVPTFCVRTTSGFRIWADGCILAPSLPISSQDVSTHPSQLALAAAMERTIRAYPKQWMAFMNLQRINEPSIHK